MISVLRAAAIYGFLLLVFRLSGKRGLAQITTFDFVLLLIISEVTQQAMTGNDFSILNAALCILTLVSLDVGLSLWKARSRTVERVVDSVPLIVVSEGKPLIERMKEVRIDEEDILAAAREKQGLERMDQIKYAVLERDGVISIIPASDAS
jgi:uncharacterized membrane protein YcaP (DUF421 family)